jgi:hypothetical protein
MTQPSAPRMRNRIERPQWRRRSSNRAHAGSPKKSRNDVQRRGAMRARVQSGPEASCGFAFSTDAMTTPGNLRSLGIVAHPLNMGCQVLNSMLSTKMGPKFRTGLRRRYYRSFDEIAVFNASSVATSAALEILQAIGQRNDPYIAPGSQNQGNCRSVGNDRRCSP